MVRESENPSGPDKKCLGRPAPYLPGWPSTYARNGNIPVAEVQHGKKLIFRAMTTKVPELQSGGSMKVTEVPRALQGEMLRNIENYSIILLLNGKLCGSGTLVKVNGIEGILTAGHVVQRLIEHEQTGNLSTVLDRRESNLVEESLKHFGFFSMSPFEGKFGPFGPDLAFIRIPAPSGLLSGIRMKKSFWDMTRANVARRPVTITENTPMASYGAVDEKTETEESLVHLNAFLLYGSSPTSFMHEGYDYIDLRSRRSLQPEIPNSFGGLSGGGVWRFDIVQYTQDCHQACDFHLFGVAFYQLPETEPDFVQIRNHGPLSIYQRYLPEVQKWLQR